MIIALDEENQAGNKEMAPPVPMSCSNAACDFTTPNNIPTYELIIKALELHTQAAHGRVNATNQAHSKVEKPKRPSISTGLSEADWQFILHKWERYKRQTALSEPELTDELWACMDSDLEKLAFSDGSENLTSDRLLDKIKSLAVTTLHPSVHVVTLHQMKQNDQETTKAFSARVKGTANNCDLQKRCPKPGCSEVVSFNDETCYHVVMAGLANQDLKDKVLTQALLGVIKDLPTLLNFTAAEESARARDKVHEISVIRKRQFKPKIKRCGNCGNQAHGKNNKDRISQCPAQGKTCLKCEKLHHFASVCRTAKTAAAVQSQNHPSENSDISDDSSIVGFIATIKSGLSDSSFSTAASTVAELRSASTGPITTLPVPHFVFDKQLKKWKRGRPQLLMSLFHWTKQPIRS